jgi:Uma2 family endonuclease
MSARATASPPQVAADDRVVLHHVTWETYERLLADDVERRVPRMTYDQGVLELVTPSKPHEMDAATIVRVVDIVAAVLGIPVQSVGSTTYRRNDLHRGFEPDASFYIQNEARVRDRREINLAVDPPPDLILEMEMSRTVRDKLPLFASMGIVEIWHCDGERVTILTLDQNECQTSPASLALPALTSEVLTRFLAASRTMLSPEWFLAVSDWAQAQQDLTPER